MPASGMKRAERRQTIPLRKSDTEHLFDFFMHKQKLKTLPSECDVTTGVQRVLESTTTTTSTDANTNSLQVEEQQQFKRTNSYRKATRLSIYDNVEDMAPSPFQMTEDRMFKKEDYDYRKYKTLPPESATLRRASHRKRKSSEAQMNNNNNNKSTNYNEKSPHHIQRSGSIASSDTDGEDEVSINTIDRKKKSAFKRAKERILQTFTKQKKTDEEKKKKKKKKSKAKQSPPSKKKTQRDRGKDGGKVKDECVVVMDENGHSTSHVTQTRHGNILVRREESMDVKDCVTPSSPCVHSESHTMVTDTRDLSTKSKPTAITRLRRSMRRKFSDASKSPKEENKAGPSSINVSTSGSDQRRRLSRHTSLSSPSSPCPVGQFRQPANTVTKVFEAIISQDAEQEVPQGRRTRSAARGGVNVLGDRSRLQLNGLVPCHPLPHSLPSSGNFSADIETDTHTKYVRSPDGYMDVVTDVHESVHMCPMEVDDVEADCPNDRVDGFEPVAKKGRGSSRRRLLLGTEENPIPFDQLSQDEKNKRIESVANRLAVIADNYVTRAESSQSDNECQSPTTHRAGRHPPDRLNSIERDLVMELRKEGDRLSETMNMPSLIMPIAIQLVKETDQYNRFTKVVESSLGGTVGWHNVAMYFYVTKAAVQMAGAGGAVALRLKDMALQYFSDRFAGWITDRGGWDSVLEETDSELD
ncbi:uncharacterized protein LOC110446774 [Mizuhopecten yessoensis]|uniref:Uncharacterized protein n=1 Tax=Mizuhopecten yessoensis TaxID=6573 RepID=A0A210QWT5_MIZYE|nr:uncharacterized protein LOC110446774 [Mizuhopecten yessoensis]XP_021347751.1 uncharacterized protein LOC110446774 [Mizuhopecten yessoensis]XP_021347752.1 uncharacterized protein LOC110446774 [Mizuhopecten yessoensis]OWF53166.1 hypothetical protein KP79_PYT06991 [Mizuhopecten yessoensis]